MRLQTSIEFILVLSAIALFSIFVIAQYMHIQTTQKAAYGILGNQSSYSWPGSNVLLSAQNSISVVPIVSNLSYVNRSNSLQVIVTYPKSYNLIKINVSSTPNVTVFPQVLNNLSYSQFQVLTFSFFPNEEGVLKFQVQAILKSANNATPIIASAYTYAIQQNSTRNSSGNNGFVAFLTNRNESVLYPLSKQNGVTTINSWSHCAYHDFWGNRESEPLQCGMGTWGFVASDGSCNVFWAAGRDRYYCFSQVSSGDKTAKLEPQTSFTYNAVLNLRNSTLSLMSDLTSASENSILVDNTGKLQGITEVNGVYTAEILPSPYVSYAILNNTQKLSPINYSYYDNYSSARSSLLNTLLVYNGTWVGGDVLNYVQKTVLQTNVYENILLAAPPAETNCAFYPASDPSFYSCKSVLPFSYNITVSIDNLSKLNQTLQYQGSLIEIR